MNEPPRVTDVSTGITTPDGKVAVIVDDDVKAPDADAVKPTVHDVVEPAFARVGANVTALTDVPAVIVTPDAGLTATPSTDVAMLKPVLASVCAVGFLMPESERVAAVELASAHVPPRLTVTVWPDTVADADEQVPVKPVPSVTVSDAGSTTPLGNTMVTVEELVSAPVDDDVKPTVHGVTTLALVRVGVKVTPVTAVPAVIVTPLAGLAGRFAEVATLNEVFARVCADGFVSPLIVNVPAVEFASVHVEVSVTTTVLVESASVAPVQMPLKPVPIVTVDCVGMTTPEGKVTVIVEPALSAPDALVVKPTAQFVVAFAFARAGANVTALTAEPKTMFEPESTVGVVSWDVETVNPEALIV